MPATPGVMYWRVKIPGTPVMAMRVSSPSIKARRISSAAGSSVTA
jgi:hypothetical protein